MIDALHTAGFLGITVEGDTIHARLWASSAEFSARPAGGGNVGLWEVSLIWPIRASTLQIANWNDAHPDLRMDLHGGETRVRLLVAEGDMSALHHWAAGAEEAVATFVRWRRAQRAPGEGM